MGHPQPLTRRLVWPPHLWFRGEGHTRWRERVWESPNSDEGAYTVVVFIYTYFVRLGRRRKEISVSSEQQLKKKNYSRWDSYLNRRDLELMKDVNNGPGLNFV